MEIANQLPKCLKYICFEYSLPKNIFDGVMTELKRKFVKECPFKQWHYCGLYVIDDHTIGYKSRYRTKHYKDELTSSTCFCFNG